MQWRQTSVLGAARRMLGFLHENRTDVPRFSTGVHRDEVEAHAAALAACLAAQELEKTTGTSLTKVKNTVRRDLLLEFVQPIVSIAHKIKASGEKVAPSIQTLRMPAQRTPDAALVSKARGMATGVARHQAAFDAQRLPPDFASQTREAADALQDAMRACQESLVNRIRATKQAAQETTRLRDAIRVLDRVVSSELHATTRLDLLAAWKQEKRFARKPGVKRK